MVKTLVFVAIGGALGASARLLSVQALTKWLGMGFPYGTLFVNIVGSFAMGIIIELLALRFQTSPEMKIFLTTGFLGGFTTFSTFSLDAALMLEKKQFVMAMLYMSSSVILSVGALFAGLMLVRSMVAS